MRDFESKIRAARLKLLLSMFFCVLLITGMKSNAASSTVVMPLNGEWVSQRIENDSDELWYRFVVPSDGKVQLTFQAFRSATYYYLYNEDKSVKYFRLQQNDASASSPVTNGKTCWLKKGVYQIYAADNMAYSFGGAGDIRVKAVFTSANATEREPNNSFDQAMNLQENVKVRGVLTDIDDNIDFYRIVVPYSCKLIINVTAMYDGAEIDLYSSDYVFKKQFRIFDGTETAPKTKSWTESITPGVYYFKVTDNFVGGNASGIYEISWSTSIVADSISLNTTTATIYAGDVLSLYASVSPSNVTNSTVVWSSSDPSVAIVSANGSVQGIGQGTAQIKAATGDGTNLSASCSVTVKERSLSISPTAVSIYKGKKARLKATTDPWTAVIYTSSNKKVATVDSKGVVRAKKAGTCKITAKANGRIQTITVKVKNPSLKVSRSKITLKVGKTYTLRVTSYPKAAVSYTSSNKKIASVSRKGKIKARKPGNCKITVKANGVKKKVTVKVVKK